MPRKRIIAISGVPGVGKSRVSLILARQLGADLVSLTELVKTGRIKSAWDSERKTMVLEVKDVQRAVDKTMRQKRGQYVIEGLLAHLLKADIVFILRCDPTVLRRRLLGRKWPKRKIEENVQAELLDAITVEAAGKKNVYEIDTTHKTARQTAATIARILGSVAYGKKFRPGKISWLIEKEIA